MNKFRKFLLMGSTAFAVAATTFVVLSASMSQDDLYQDVVTSPVESVQSFLGIKSHVKDKYQNFIASDKAFLASMDIPKEIIDIDIIYKSHGLVDKAFYPLMKVGQWVFNYGDAQKEMNESKYDGTNSMYNAYLDKDGKILNEYIMLGVNALEAKDMSTYKNLYKIFGYDEQKMTSFVFFHEFGHKIANALNNEEQNLDTLVTLFEKEKDIILTKEDKKIIRTQYSETYADNFGLMMMVKKYPELDFEKCRDLLAGLRLNNSDETHLSSPGIIQAQKPGDKSTLKDIMVASEKGALATAEFYSPIDFTNLERKGESIEKRSIPVVFSGLNAVQVRDKMNSAREKFLSSSKHDLPTYKE
jgi:hypothetical protein